MSRSARHRNGLSTPAVLGNGARLRLSVALAGLFLPIHPAPSSPVPTPLATEVPTPSTASRPAPAPGTSITGRLAAQTQAEDPFEGCSAEGVLRGDVRPDLYCFALQPTDGFEHASGRIEMRRVQSPFGVAVTAEGHHRFRLLARIDGLSGDPAAGRPEAEQHGIAPGRGAPRPAYVAWATTPILDPMIKLGEVRNGANDLGEVALNKFLILVTQEASAEVAERSGPLVLRGRSPANLMEAHDLLTIAPSAIFPAAPGAAPPPAGVEPPGEATAHAGHSGPEGEGPGWSMPPMHPANPMLPGMAALLPTVAPFLPSATDIGTLPEARPSQLVRLADGGTLDLEARLVRRTLKGRNLVMFGFNGQVPGPLIHVPERATIFVNLTNHTGLPTTIHWHGVRLDNRFDGVPGVTQDPVMPGETFRYQIFFRDPGIYWYHPHHREDIQQELGLYGNMLVESPRQDYYGPANRDAVLMLDDLLLGERGLVPFGIESSNYMLMGRFGNVFLVNGEPDYDLRVRRGEVVRFFFTNVSNTRTFNLSLREAGGTPAGAGRTAGNAGDAANAAVSTLGSAEGTVAPSPSSPTNRSLPVVVSDRPLRMKVVGSDIGKFEREEWVESLVISPAERYIVDVRFPEAGTFALANHVQAIHHLYGRFFDEVDVIGVVEVAGEPAGADHSAAFEILRTNDEVVADIDRYRDRFDDAPDLELLLTLETRDLPAPVEQLMQFDSLYFNPVEWSGTMPMMNWVTGADTVSWILRDPTTGKRNMDIDWRFRVGDVVKVRLVNDRDAFHAMQHPFHIHGQRFLVVAQDGVPTENLVWKDTVLLPVGTTTDILLELSNPGRWMAHCHIAEHLESGMKLVFEVEGEGPLPQHRSPDGHPHEDG